MKALIFSVICVLTMVQTTLGQVSKQVSNAVTTEKEAKNIIIYGSDTCHYCLDTKAYLKEKKVDFIYYDVDENLSKQREMIAKLQKAAMSLDNVSLPVVEKSGKLFMNSGSFDAFLKQLTD